MSEDRERQDQMSAGGNQQSGELVYWWVPRGEERVFELPGWSAETRQLVRTLFAGSDVGHRWEGDKVVVPGESRDDAAALLDEIVAASRPPLDAQADRVGYEMVDWPQHEVELLRQTLTDKEIIHEFTDDEELLVYEGDEATVDALFEELGLLGPNPGVELDGETLTSLLNDLYLATDRLSRVATDPDAVVATARSVGDRKSVV